MKEKGKDATLGTIFGATWGDKTFEIPYGEMDWPASALLPQWEPDWVSKEPTPLKEPKEPGSLKPEPCQSGVALGPSCLERALTPRMAAPKEGPYQDRPLLCPFRLLPLLTCSGSALAFLKLQGPKSKNIEKKSSFNPEQQPDPTKTAITKSTTQSTLRASVQHTGCLTVAGMYKNCTKEESPEICI